MSDREEHPAIDRGPVDRSQARAPSPRRGRFPARLAAEFAVIVLGVLTALATDAWVQGRADRRIEAEYLERLRDDVAGHLGEIEQTAQLNLWALDGARELLDLLESGGWKSMAPESLTPLVLRASTSVQLNSRLVTYDEILASGRLGLIEDRDVRTALADHHRVHQEFGNLWTYARGRFWTMVTRTVHPDVVSRYYETSVTPVDRSPESITRPMRTEDACTLELGDWSPTALIATLESPSTLQDLQASMWYQQTSSGALATVIEPAARRLERVIAEALEGR